MDLVATSGANVEGIKYSHDGRAYRNHPLRSTRWPQFHVVVIDGLFYCVIRPCPHEDPMHMLEVNDDVIQNGPWKFARS